jgi:hypothetical protein
MTVTGPSNAVTTSVSTLSKVVFPHALLQWPARNTCERPSGGPFEDQAGFSADAGVDLPGDVEKDQVHATALCVLARVPEQSPLGFCVSEYHQRSVVVSHIRSTAPGYYRRWLETAVDLGTPHSGCCDSFRHR